MTRAWIFATHCSTLSVWFCIILEHISLKLNILISVKNNNCGLKWLLIKFNWLSDGCPKVRSFNWFVSLCPKVLIAVVLKLIWMPHSVTMSHSEASHIGQTQWWDPGANEDSRLFPSLVLGQAMSPVRKQLCWESRQEPWCFYNGSEDSSTLPFPVGGHFYERDRVSVCIRTATAGASVASGEAEKLRLPCPILSLLWLKCSGVWKTPRGNSFCRTDTWSWKDGLWDSW